MRGTQLHLYVHPGNGPHFDSIWNDKYFEEKHALGVTAEFLQMHINELKGLACADETVHTKHVLEVAREGMDNAIAKIREATAQIKQAQRGAQGNE